MTKKNQIILLQEHINEMKKDFRVINNHITGIGLKLPSPEYFRVREICDNNSRNIREGVLIR